MIPRRRPSALGGRTKPLSRYDLAGGNSGTVADRQRPVLGWRGFFARDPRRLPVVLSPEEVARLLAAAPDVKYQAALSIAYGAGLRASKVISLRVGDIDSARMLIRVDQGKEPVPAKAGGHKDRYVMLSQQLLDLLRRGWLVKRPREWLFPGRVRGAPLTCGSSTAPSPRPRSGPGSTSAWVCAPSVAARWPKPPTGPVLPL